MNVHPTEHQMEEPMTVTEPTEPTPAPAPSTEGLTLDPHGYVVISFGGQEWRLRRPTFGEFRQANEAIERMRAETIKANEAAPALAASGNDPVLGVYAGIAGHRLAFWQEIIPLLSGHPLPSEDDLPYWIVSADLVNDATEHWLTVPRVAPGE